MKKLLTILLICSTIFLSGCFLNIKTEGMEIKSGSVYPPSDKTPSSEVTE